MDSYSRSIVHHEVRTNMATGDVEIVVERALETLPPERPRLITDNLTPADYLQGPEHIQQRLAE